MNTHDLKPGDRVRVTASNRLADYQPGEKGTVLRAYSWSISLKGKRC
jgi:hypothetical protein